MANLSDETVRQLRPRLHRYCARMLGSVIDAEDAVQETLVRVSTADGVRDVERLAFTVAQRWCIDLLRRRAHQASADDLPGLDTADSPEQIAVAAALETFMQLTVPQRSAVILMDVLGYSAPEIAQLSELSETAVKASIHRGRKRLRELSAQREAPRLSLEQSALLQAYVRRFNERDFDAVRAMLAEEVRLDLVGRSSMRGRAQVSTYFSNYDRQHDWRFEPGFVESREVALAFEPGNPAPVSFVLLDWHDGALRFIRDFRYARYVMDGARVTLMGTSRTGA